MAFSPEPLPAEEPYASDETVWKISDGICGITESLEHTAHAIKRLVQERDDAVAAADAHVVIRTEQGFQLVAMELDLAQTRSRNAALLEAKLDLQDDIALLKYLLAEANHKLDEREEGIIWVTAERPTTGENRPNKRKLSDFEASQIRDYARQTGAKVKDIANRWGVHSSTISRILNGKAY